MSSNRLKLYSIRAALFCASFVITAFVMGAVGSAFHSMSSRPWLRNTPEARATIAACSARSDRHAQRDCRVQTIAAAEARDAAPTRLAVSEPAP